MLFDIICPLCMKRYPANNVVFRHDRTKLNAAGRDVSQYEAVDLYQNAYYEAHQINKVARMRLQVVDPAYFPEQDKTYNNGLLVGLRNAEGYQMDERVCPYCHNKLYASAGRMPIQQMAIIGASGSGKTSFEAAMIHQLRQHGIGCTNNTLTEQGGIDDVVEKNIQIMMQGKPDPAQGNGGEQVQASTGWNATQLYHGPYIYSITPGRNSQPLALVFYDLPGEHFKTNVQGIRDKAPYIATAKTCLCLIDLNRIETIFDVIAALENEFSDEMKYNGVNMALLLYKADQLDQAVKGIARTLKPLNLQPHAPIDMRQIDASSDQLLRFVAARDYRLDGTYEKVSQMLGADNVRMFMAQSYNEDGEFEPRGCDVPLLWSFAKQGLYPQTM